MNKNNLWVLFFFWKFFIAFSQDTSGHYSYFKKELSDALNEGSSEKYLSDTIITDKKTAIAIGETILFKVYGQTQIEEEKPYEVMFIDGYYILEGTIHDRLGGVFLLILQAKDGRVLRLSHGK
ncbi:MAG TPA: NTF2 fold immunity protein [Bacteroidia bacterium]